MYQGHRNLLNGILPAVKVALTKTYKKGSKTRIVRDADFVTIPGMIKAAKKRTAALLEPSNALFGSKTGYINGSIKPPETTSLSYDAWLCNDQLVMSWMLNSMEPKLSELFSYLESLYILWEAVKEMYESQNNTAHVFQLKKNLASLKQGDQAFVQHLGNLKNMWNELDLYRPHTTDSLVLLKRAYEDKVFQILASLGSEYEDLRSHVLMTLKLPSFASVCQAVQREETRRKVMSVEIKTNLEARAFNVNHKSIGDK
ncbi:uncharacterized protein LOC126584179 [Malus sylvestris]|uniref:uncharacterized protein LOC126584179 n=1 Tax=Malus sylvestris TaxID=3752 RepID=UPI0021AC468B|nr:uncharacterized protein LOC126584179 [Malus sylvestris]